MPALRSYSYALIDLSLSAKILSCTVNHYEGPYTVEILAACPISTPTSKACLAHPNLDLPSDLPRKKKKQTLKMLIDFFDLGFF